jgi:hypothetical protein
MLVMKLCLRLLLASPKGFPIARLLTEGNHSVTLFVTIWLR